MAPSIWPLKSEDFRCEAKSNYVQISAARSTCRDYAWNSQEKPEEHARNPQETRRPAARRARSGAAGTVPLMTQAADATAPPSEPARCGITLDTGAGCSRSTEPNAPLNLCTSHLLQAYDWVAADVGTTDLLPSPCLACGGRVGVKYPAGWLCAICEWRVGELPDQEATTPRLDVVYYIRFQNQIKIGTSANPRLRLASLPCDEVLAFERGGRALEQRRHAQFAEHRLARSEWFSAGEHLTRHIEELQAGVDDPWHPYSVWVSRALSL